MKKGILVAVAGLILFTQGCASQKYYWGNYETELYRYYKNPGDIDRFSEKLADIVEKGESNDRVPPGMYAEYGYILFTQHKEQEAITCFEKEMGKWPESAGLMETMIETVKNGGERELSAEVREEGAREEGAQEEK